MIGAYSGTTPGSRLCLCCSMGGRAGEKLVRAHQLLIPGLWSLLAPPGTCTLSYFMSSARCSSQASSYVLLPTGREEREVLGVGSIPVAILPSCQDMKTIAL